MKGLSKNASEFSVLPCSGLLWQCVTQEKMKEKLETGQKYSGYGTMEKEREIHKTWMTDMKQLHVPRVIHKNMNTL